MRYTTAHCNTLQHTAIHNPLYSVDTNWFLHSRSTLSFYTLQCTAVRCNTLQHTATHCNTLQHTATHCNTLQHSATHCNTLQHTAIILHSKSMLSSYICNIYMYIYICMSPTLSIYTFNLYSHSIYVMYIYIYMSPTLSLYTLILHSHSTLSSYTTPPLHMKPVIFWPLHEIHSHSHPTLCNTLQHTTTHCNTLQHTAIIPHSHPTPP